MGVAMVGVVVVTHGGLAEELVGTARMIMGTVEQVEAVGFQPDEREEEMFDKLRVAVRAVDEGDGVLILVDMFGGTPSNLSLRLLRPGRVEVVTGVNLPMLLKAGNTPRCDLQTFARKVRDSGVRNALLASTYLENRKH